MNVQFNESAEHPQGECGAAGEEQDEQQLGEGTFQK